MQGGLQSLGVGAGRLKLDGLQPVEQHPQRGPVQLTCVKRHALRLPMQRLGSTIQGGERSLILIVQQLRHRPTLLLRNRAALIVLCNNNQMITHVLRISCLVAFVYGLPGRAFSPSTPDMQFNY